jgi:hypothetical protein
VAGGAPDCGEVTYFASRDTNTDRFEVREATFSSLKTFIKNTTTIIIII